ncbi:type II toxin-antitoxin system death-on-curing family toxin [Sinomonas atrocyanea]
MRDVGLLGSALARPATTVMGRPAYPALPLQAAALLESTVRNRPLVDGNKRTAWVLVVVFLALNGAEHDMGAHQVFDLVVGVADGTVELEKSAEILVSPTPRRPRRQTGAGQAPTSGFFKRLSLHRSSRRPCQRLPD